MLAILELEPGTHPAELEATVLRRQNQPRTLAILGLALVLRIFVLFVTITAHPLSWFYSRGLEMGLLAKSILAGQGLSSPFGGFTGPTAFIAPAYPIFVATVFRCFGVESASSAIVILAVHALLNVLTVWLVIRLAVSLFDVRTANVAGTFWACSLPLIWLPTIFWDTCISTCLIAGLILLALKSQADPTRTRWVLLGAYCAFAGLVNPALLPAFLSVYGYIALRTRSIQNSVLGAMVMAALFSPWPVRNAIVFHAFVPTRTTVGFELWMGNHSGASGYLEESLFPMFNPKELENYKTLGEISYTNHKRDEAEKDISSNLSQFLKLTTTRFFRFWFGTGTRGGSSFFMLHACLTTLLGLAGLRILWARRPGLAILLGIPLAVFPLPYYITHAEFRYRIVIDPILTLLAAYAITYIGTAQYGHITLKDPQTSAQNRG